MSSRLLIVLLLAPLGLATGCEVESRGKSVRYLGNLDDYSYANRITKEYGPSAAGEMIRFADFEGRFVWVDFAAPWCPPCVRQAGVVQRLERNFDERVLFLTMMTSDASPAAPATEQTARSWAGRHGLSPAHVVPCGESGRTIPQHMLFSPLGQLLEWKTGFLDEVEIRAILTGQMIQWNRWHAENGDSMSLLLRDTAGNGR